MRREDQKAGKVVGLWNARIAREAEPLFVPTIAAAFRAGRHSRDFRGRPDGDPAPDAEPQNANARGTQPTRDARPGWNFLGRNTLILTQAHVVYFARPHDP